MPDELYVTFTTKPLGLAGKDGSPIVKVKVKLSELSGDILINLVNEAAKRLAGDGAN